MSCPWDSLQQAPLEFCERSLCAWVKQPGNTWSNIPYVLIGFAIYHLARKEKNRHLIWIGIVGVITGLGSSFLHMSGTYIGGCADYLGMFLATGLLTGYNVRRWLRCSFRTMYFVYGATTALFMALLYLFPQDHRFLYGFGMPCCLIELRIFFRDRRQINYRPYLLMSALVLVATLFWWLDTTKRLCDPDNHFLSGHGVWHLLTAITFFPLYTFYSQFTLLKSEPV